MGEGYFLPWYFAATKTSTDAYEKRRQKGLLFTIGDEPPHLLFTREQAKRILDVDLNEDIAARTILEMVRRQYDVFHVIVEQGSGLCDYGEEAVVGGWNELLGEGRVLRLKDYTKLSEVVISAIQLNAGADRDAVVKSWSGSTSLVVAGALPKTGVARRPGGGHPTGGPVRLRAPNVV